MPISSVQRLSTLGLRRLPGLEKGQGNILMRLDTGGLRHDVVDEFSDGFFM